ncbi:hypothetical protein WN55_02621 [Dufourea novaeangliae]|uniref:DUF4817 domain-containing protein n=1 Tax=Dufourea novaeangliae TaxID=178035 RepID=A0A154PI19_DUFNO|nr:hypothetical protein WN55_02621 [Dufourea novaeangliae]
MLAAVAHNPYNSTRQISRGSGISQSSVVRILHLDNFHPYQLSVHQKLHGRDFDKCVQFCDWLLDGCPAHYTRYLLQILNRIFPNRWIGHGSNIVWPARLPNLTSLDYLIWGTLKNEVYRKPRTTAEDMRERIISACVTINEKTLEKVLHSLVIRLRKCIDCNGQHFEHRLK